MAMGLDSSTDESSHQLMNSALTTGAVEQEEPAMASTADAEVVVVGAGPGGLLLATELALAGVSCRVLERRPHRTRESRATGLQARTLEQLDMRGLADDFLARGNPQDHFRITLGGTRIDLRSLDTAYQQLSICPQSTTEELLEDRAVSLGVQVERDVQVLGVRSDADRATLRVRRGPDGETETRQAAWVVGADGSHSVVRDSVGIGFVGKTYPYNVVVGDVRLAHPPESGMLIEVSRHGIALAIDFGNGWWRMGTVDWSTPKPTGTPVPPAELAGTLRPIFGRDLGLSDPLWTSRFQFQKRHASTYRRDRVLLVGDAAHVHAPLGAQGLNMSMQDAFNLGWKLAAVIRHGAPVSLVDSYERERRPIASRVLAATDRAIGVMMSRRPPVQLVRRLLLPTVAGVPTANHHIAERVSNLAVWYPPRDGQRHHPLVGRRIPDLRVHADGGFEPLFRRFRAGKFVFLDQSGGRLVSACEPWTDRVEVVTGRIARNPVVDADVAVLVRPDGYCAWAGSASEVLSLRAALHRWCGSGEHRSTSVA
jgi:2-polyprenyl-6-methoxyphenol hydroxylase-like FAD-dependent oxidoreductase